MRDKNKIIIVLSVLLPTLILVGFLLTRKSYLIRDVPYVNIWTHGDGYMSAAALYDVLAYWNKRDPSLLAPSPEFLADRFPQWEEQHLADFLDYAKSELGYEGALIRANSAKDLRRFLNRTSQTPLIIVRNFSKDVSYRPFAVVIGINPGKSVVLHDYYLGQAYTMPIQEFEDLWTLEDGGKYFVAIRPKNYRTITLGKEPSPSSQYSLVDPRFVSVQNILRHYIEMETHAFWQGREPDYTKALSHLSLITEDPAYDSLPRFWKVAVQGNVAYFLMKQYEIGGKQDRSLLEQATPYLERAVALNNDLASSEAVAGWPEPFVRVVVGTKIALKYVTTIPAQHHSPYYLQGIMNESLGDTEKAVSSYRKALELHVGPAPDIERRLKNLGDGINP